MLAKLHSMGIFGIEAFSVEVEVYVAKAQMPRATVVGLPDASVRESIERVRAALRNTGYNLPPIAATVNLAPADRRKEGPAFELPIALGLLAATENLRISGTSRYAIVGELALDGRVRPVQGCLPMALRAREVGLDGIIVPMDNAREAAIVTGLHVVPVSSLREAVGFLALSRPGGCRSDQGGEAQAKQAAADAAWDQRPGPQRSGVHRPEMNRFPPTP